jgi:hypothetical protein
MEYVVDNIIAQLTLNKVDTNVGLPFFGKQVPQPMEMYWE